MTFTYSSSYLGTDLAKVRRLIGDTDSTNALFSDEELNFMIDEGGDIWMASAIAARAIAGSKALLMRKLTIGDLTEDYGDIAGDLLKQAAMWERKSWSASGAGSRHV